MIRILIATRNAHKVGEIRAILGEGFRYLTLNDFPGAPEVVEDAGTFAGNARKKSEELAQWWWRSQELGARGGEAFCVLADDSGLEVDALHGAPGVHSARFAALDSGQSGNSSTAQNNAKLLRLLEGVPSEKRTARFRCVLALTRVPVPSAIAPQQSRAVQPKFESTLYEGTCEGRIGFGPQGQGGFGYDPLFFPAGFDQTFGELGEAVKNRLSHRAKALAKLRRSLIECGKRSTPT
jgi:XTP/dITP diphosphohydrolase